MRLRRSPIQHLGREITGLSVATRVEPTCAGGGHTCHCQNSPQRHANDEITGAVEPGIPVQIYLTDAEAGPAVDESLRELLLMSGVEKIFESSVIFSLWCRRLTGVLKRAADSDAASEARRTQLISKLSTGSRRVSMVLPVTPSPN